MRQSGTQVVVALATTASFGLRQVKLREAKKTQHHCIDWSLLPVLKLPNKQRLVDSEFTRQQYTVHTIFYVQTWKIFAKYRLTKRDTQNLPTLSTLSLTWFEICPWSNFDPSQNPNPLTDYDKTLHNWLRPQDEQVVEVNHWAKVANKTANINVPNRCLYTS